MRRLVLGFSVFCCLLAVLGAGAGAAKKPRPDCRKLLPMAKVEEVLGGTVTLERFEHSDFIRNATTPGTEQGTECVYGATEETANAYGFVGTVSTAFAETPKDWNGYRDSAKQYPGLEATTFAPLKLGGKNQAFVLHQENVADSETGIYYLYVYTPGHNIFSIDFLNGVTLKTEEALARELSKSLDASAPKTAH